MAVLPSTTPFRVQLIGIALTLVPGRDAATGRIWKGASEVQRAPDSGGSPGTWATLVDNLPPLPAAGAPFVDQTPATGARWHYRWRHKGPDVGEGAWSNSVSALPALIPKDVLAASINGGTASIYPLIVTSPTLAPDVIKQVTEVGTNAAVNGDYEQGVTNWRVSSASGGAHTMEAITASPIEGAKSLKITIGGVGTTSRVQQCDRQTDVDDSTDGGPLYLPVQPLDEVWGTVKVNIGLLAGTYALKVEEYDSAKSLIQRTTIASKVNTGAVATFQLYGGVVLQTTTRYIIIIHEFPGSFSDDTGTFKVDAAQVFRIPSKQRCHVYRSAAKAITSQAALTPMDWDTEAYDIGGIHDNATNNQRLTVTSAAANRGVVQLLAQIEWAAGTTGYRRVVIRNGTTILAEDTRNGTNTIETRQQVKVTDNAPVAGDYYECLVAQTQGTNLNVNNGQWISYFLMDHKE